CLIGLAIVTRRFEQTTRIQPVQDDHSALVDAAGDSVAGARHIQSSVAFALQKKTMPYVSRVVVVTYDFSFVVNTRSSRGGRARWTGNVGVLTAPVQKSHSVAAGIDVKPNDRNRAGPIDTEDGRGRTVRVDKRG